MRPLTVTLTLVALSFCVPREAAAQLDPLLFIKNDNAKPNILVAVETTNRMQRDANNDYLDGGVYTKSGTLWEGSLDITAANTAVRYRRKYVNLQHTDASLGGDRFSADTIRIVGDLEPGYATFDEATRLSIARRGLIEAINRNLNVARFGLLRTRQNNPRLGALKNEGPVAVADIDQELLTETGGTGKWKITRPEVDAVNGSIAGPVLPLTAPDAANANATILATLAKSVGTAGALTPGGRDSKDILDAPLDLMLADVKAEAARLATAGATVCRNTVAILVLGGGQGNSSAGDPAANALEFLNIGSDHRVPIYVIAIVPAVADIPQLQAIAANSGGVYTEITAAMVAATAPGTPIPEFVRAVNLAVQHAFVPQTTLDIDPSPSFPIGKFAEHQVTSPIIGTVNLDQAPTLSPAGPIVDGYLVKNGTEIPQRSNLLITTGFSLPGFDAKMRAFRVYKPVVDESRPSGYKFVADGTPMWVAQAPTPDRRNIFTALPDGTVVPFTLSSAAQLQEYLRTPDLAATEKLITFIRQQPLGAIVGSTPAIMDPPSLDPPPDAIYPAFALANKKRRSMVWVGANDGMLHGIDARLGYEVWAFVPFNLLPKLQTLRSGQPVGDFRYFVDSSPKVADVKIAGAWRTYMIMGEGAGGTFYQTFDVTLENMGDTVSPTENNIDVVLTYFSSATSVPLKWTFPQYKSFDWTIAPHGDIALAALPVEKTVGETWSDPAIGQIEGPTGKFAVLTGSGFFKWSLQEQPNRAQAVAGSTFYLLDIETGAVFDSRDVGNDNKGEKVDNCAAVNDCTQLKNALQADPVATGPPDSRFVTKAYMGDLDGKIWRFDIGLDATGTPKIKGLVSLYTVNTGSGQASAHPIFASMATLNVGGTKQYLFVGTGSDLLPSNAANHSFALLVILDNGATGSKTAQIALEKTDGLAGEEKISAFPAVAGDIVFFTTTTYFPGTPCTLPNGNLYAFTFIGGPAYDTNNDGKFNNTDSTKVSTAPGRATAPFIVDQHLITGVGGNLKMFGDAEDFNNGVGQVGVRILSWREVR